MARELKIFDDNSSNILESYTSHQAPLILVQSFPCNGSQLAVSSSSVDVKVWDGSSIQGAPLRSFEGCRAARFDNTGTGFAAFPTEASQLQAILYDV